MVLGESFIIWSKTLITQFSYLAIFAVSLASTSTIFLPFPIYVIIFFAAGLGMNPFLVGIIAGLGSAFGELTGYLIGLGGENVIKQKKKKDPAWINYFVNLFKKHGFPIVVIAAAIPFPFDVIGILCGIGNYDIKKFLIATSIGKIIKCLVIAYAGLLGIPYIERIMGIS
jgi:membrane protein DedA with SNARE-associated domain